MTGIWRGYFITSDGEQYKLEFQVEQNNTNVVTGVSYSYLTTIFYGKAIMTGHFKKPDSSMVIQELRTVEVRMSNFSVTCIMNYNLNYSQSGKEEFLEGSYTSKYEKRDSIFGALKGKDCGGGIVYLHKVPTSDFYVEPFLRDKPRVNTNTTVNKPPLNPPVKTNPPLIKKTNPVVKAKPPVVKKTNPPVKKNTTVNTNKAVVKTNTEIKKDTTKKIVIEPTVKKPTPEKKIASPSVLTTRQNALAQTIFVNTGEVIIKLYDNGEIDGDTISVYVDKQLVLSNKMLTAAALTLKLHFSENETEHEVVMVAENLGRYPPNTSLMVINAGNEIYKVQITSTEQKNAMVRFKYIKPG